MASDVTFDTLLGRALHVLFKWCVIRHNDHYSYIHSLSSCEIKAWKKSGLSEIQTHDLSDIGAVLYQLSYQAE